MQLRTYRYLPISSFSALTLLVGSFDLQKPVPDMTYNVFGGTLSLTQSINQPATKREQYNGSTTMTYDAAER